MKPEDLAEIFSSVKFEKVEQVPGEVVFLYRVPSEKGCVEFVKLLANTRYLPHIHDNVDAHLIMITGSGKITLYGNEIMYKPGDTYEVPRGTAHGFETKTETIFISVQSSPIMNKETGELDFRYPDS